MVERGGEPTLGYMEKRGAEEQRRDGETGGGERRQGRAPQGFRARWRVANHGREQPIPGLLPAVPRGLSAWANAIIRPPKRGKSTAWTRSLHGSPARMPPSSGGSPDVRNGRGQRKDGKFVETVIRAGREMGAPWAESCIASVWMLDGIPTVTSKCLPKRDRLQCSISPAP